MHLSRPDFGAGAAVLVRDVQHHIDRYKCASVLDYGCGKGNLRRNLGSIVRNYDPAIPEFAALPEPADMVVCRDVMEHVEPEYVRDVLAHIADLTRKIAVFTISCRPSDKVTEDGRNAHITIRPAEWWKKELEQHFRLIRADGGVTPIFTGEPKEEP